MVSLGDRKKQISDIMSKDGCEDIIFKDIKNPRGIIGVPKKYAGYKAIIIIVSPNEKKGRGL